MINLASINKIALSILAFLSLSTNLYAQNKIDCSKVLEKEPSFVKNSFKYKDSLFLNDISILKHCGNLNEEDSILLQAPMLGIMMLKQIKGNGSVTYRKILNEINNIKNEPGYKDMIALKRLENKKADTLNWAENKLLFKKAGLSDKELSDFKEFIYLNSDKNLTYKFAFATFKNKLNNDNPVETGFEFAPFSDYKTALIQSKANNKLLLIYFSAYGDVHARIVEKAILSDTIIKKLLNQKFCPFITYTDDKTPLSLNNQYISSISKKNISTVGQKSTELQIKKFKTNVLPYFVIVDKNEKIVAQIMGNPSKKDFLKFLKSQ